MRPESKQAAKPKRSLWAAFLIGAGVMAAVDEIIFHQILQWHHFFDLATPAIGIVSDGLLHAAELIALITGIFLFADLSRTGALVPRRAWAGVFLGAGVFQVFDGLIDHKVLRIHQIRYGVDNLFMYDLIWNLAGLALILIGVWLLYRARSTDAHSGSFKA